MDKPAMGGAKGDLLLVEDDASALQTMEALLTAEGYDVRGALNGQMALMFAREDSPDLILLDIRLPDTDGFQVCRRLKEDHKTAGIPVIFISGLEEVVDKVKGFAAGGVDYVTKPFQEEELLARVQTHLSLRRLQVRIEEQNVLLEQEIIKTKSADEEIKRAEEALRKANDKLEERVEERTRELMAANTQLVASERALEERLRFEELLSGVSAIFVNLPAEEVNREIEATLKQVMEFFQTDYCGLLQAFQEKDSWQITHAASADGIPPVPVDTDIPVRMFPWSHHEVAEQHKYVTFATVQDLPVQADPDKQNYRKWGIRSSMLIPILLNGSHEYVFSVSMIRNERSWPAEYISRLRTLGEILVNALVRREKELELDEHLKFETLLAEISARFVNLPSDRVEAEIKDGQRRVCETLDIDRSSLWLVPEQKQEAMLLAHVDPLPESPVPERANAGDLFPWTVEKALGGEILAFSKIADLPPEASRDQESYRLYGTKSSVVIPLSVGGEGVFGLLTFGTTSQERDWPDSVVVGLKLIAQVFANALARKRTDEALRESEARLSLAAASGEVGLWSVGLRDGQIWATEKGWELLGLHPDRRMTQENFYSMIHPEDREMVRETRNQAIQSGKDVGVEYRLVMPDGSIRWMASRSRPHFTSTGEADRLTGAMVDFTNRKQMQEQLQTRLREIEDLKQRIEQENAYLREEIGLHQLHEEIVGQSEAMKRVLVMAEQVAKTNSTVLILGETGTGKELFARAIHKMSERKDRPLISVNCASLPPTLIESELFGREKGAYTGALTRMVGRFEVADGATIFLDEIGDLPLEVQSKLLRVLENGQFERLGSTKTLQVDVRIIAATNRDLAQEVQEGRFRKDLFYRLNVFPITIPPVRERPEDIPLLAWAFVRQFEKGMGKRIDTIARKRMEELQRYSWPGNVRELRNVIEHAMIVSSAKTLVVDLPQAGSSELPRGRNLEDMERGHIVDVLEKVGWRITGNGGAAEALGLKRTTLQSKMKKLGIRRPASPPP